MATELPNAQVSFLFTDIEGSTRLWEERPEDAAQLVARHDQIIREAVAAHGGRVFSTAGDSLAAAFDRGSDAVGAAVDAQLILREMLAVRMAVHTGPAEERDGDYFGPTLNRCGRLRDAAHGGQIICSQTTADSLDRLNEIDLLDLGEHRLKDLGQPEHIHQVTHPELGSEFPPLDTLSVAQTNLPIRVTSFVGRDQEMAEIDKLLLASRLVTLTGAGGCGKSRLAIECAARRVDAYPDGVWVAELASIESGASVPQTVATLLSVREPPDAPVSGALIASLERRKLLLIVDNCEHVLEPVAELVSAILTGTPNVHVLATSREALHVGGEAIYSVPPLPLPDPDADTPTVLRADAIRLFVERAAAVKPGFHLTEDTARPVASICRHLDGIPLAIELTAATTRFLPIHQIEARLDDRFQLVRHGSRDPLAHHRTLEATIDWSYDQLTPDQRTLFARLAVFEGGWTIDAAEAVCSGDPIDEDAVLHLLEALADRSLVTIIEDATENRFRYLETLHAYAKKLFHTLPGAGEVRNRHARFFAEMARSLYESQRTEEAAWSFARSASDLENLLSALDYFDETGDAQSHCQLLCDISLHLGLTRPRAETRTRLEHAIELLSSDVEPVVQGRVWMHAAAAAAGGVVSGPGENAELATTYLHRAVPLLRSEGDDRYLAIALASLMEYEGPVHAEEAIRAATRSGEGWVLGVVHSYLSLAAFLNWDYEAALEHVNSALEADQSPKHYIDGLCLKSLILSRIDASQALSVAEEAIALHEANPDIPDLSGTLRYHQEALLELEKPSEALDVMRREVELDDDNFPAIHADFAHAHALLGDIEATCRHLHELRTSGSMTTHDDLGHVDQLERVFLTVATLALQQHEPLEAAAALGAQARYRSTTPIPPSEPRRERTERITNQILSTLPRDQFDEAWQHGTTLTLDDIIDLALDTFGA